jgi:hypothetical protein
MSQSMNGMSFYGNGISETDNIICNNLACNNISSNGILTNTLTSQQITTTALSATNLTGTTATLSGSITGQNGILCSSGDITAALGNIRASYHLSGELLNLQGSILTKEIVNNLQGLDSNTKFSSSGILTNALTAKSLDLSGQILTIDIVENLKGLTKNVQNELSSLLESCLGSITTGVRNYAVGEYVFPALSSGSFNFGFGSNVSTNLESGSYNIMIGSNSGSSVRGSNNICLGQNSGQDSNPAYSNLIINNSIAIGTNSSFYDSNQIILGTDLHNTIILGTMDVKQTAKFTEAVVCSKAPTIGSHLTNRTFVESYLSSIASALTPYSLFSVLQTTVSSLQTNVNTLQTNVSSLQTSVSSIQSNINTLTPYTSFTALQTVVSSLSASLAKNKNGVFIPVPNTNGQKTVVFSTPYPVGSVVTLITSLEFTGGVIGTIQVSSITNASFKYDIFSTSSTRIESFVTVHWMAMIQ